jgi:hypothetical protein
MELFAAVGTWFGYVGACAVSPDATCRPLLAFLALGAAALAALSLILIAYRKSVAGERAAIEAERLDEGAQLLTERARRALAQPRIHRGAAAQARLAAAA